jgi:hypothetical protein
MGVMTGKAFFFLCGCVPVNLCKLLFFMAVIAKGGNRLRKYFLIRGRMRIMADNTFPLHNGFVDKLIV